MTRRDALRQFGRVAAAVLATAGVGAPVRAATASDVELLDAAAAFRLVARLERDAIVLRWRIADGYYLYRDRVRVTLEPPTVAAGPVRLPAGVRKHDDIFGDVDIWRGEVVARLPLAPSPREAARKVAIRVTSQGCADIGVCYTPNEARLELSADAPEAAPAVAPPRGESLLDALGARPSPRRRTP
ncbi:MAG: protein-disulfide reductase DsbD N-terminal domain-containing protein [Burkholderiales bacterium]|jgi:thiol:disulfide interchange protein DsbD|nr:protein-disulfide reductase DsbD N-terminal domain-containing protein [Burkholderiales bacterium]